VGAPIALSGVQAPIGTAVLSLFVEEAAAQTINANICGNAVGGTVEDVLCAIVEDNASDPGGAGEAGPGGRGGDSTADAGDGGNSGNAGDGGVSSVQDVGNADANASNSVTIDDITTGDATAHEVNVDARGATRPVVVSVAGSFPDTSVDVFAPGGTAQAGTTGGYGLTADASGGDSGDAGDGGDATSSGGDGGAGSGAAGGRGGDIVIGPLP
jgi:hypothetical protein